MAADDEMKAQAEQAPMGTVLAACPRCGSFELHWTNREDWRCPLCGQTFTEPAYYQRVPAPVAEPEAPAPE
jgi:ribosomal protein L37AE/L43A